MNRRTFLHSTVAAPIAAAGFTSQQAAATSAQASETYRSDAAVCPGDLESYFTEEKLRAAIAPVDVTVVSFEVVAYNFPTWHPSPFMEERFGKGWTEYTFGLTYSRPPGAPPGARARQYHRGLEDDGREGERAVLPGLPCRVGRQPPLGAGAHVAVNRSPDQFERLLRAAQYFAAPRLTPSHPAVVMLSAWNEWTEDHVLLPDTIWGYSYLEAVKRVFKGER